MNPGNFGNRNVSGGNSGGIAEHTLRGEIKRLVYSSEDGSFSVVKLLDEKGRENVVVGPISGAHEGQGMEVTGTWEMHREHGRRLKAKRYRFILPSTSEGIKRYLASGLIPGVGPKLAECIVGHFGEKTLDILENYSSRLREIPGFGKKRVEMVRKAWAEHSEKRDIFIYLQGLGLSLAYCQRVFKTYGEKAPLIVRDNPYRLAEDINGIGFVKADNIASNLGISSNDPKRLCAGVLYALNRMSESGHVCYPEEDFLEKTADLLSVTGEDALRGLELATKRELAVREKMSADGLVAESNYVYSSFLYRAEKELAHLLRRAMEPGYRKCIFSPPAEPAEATLDEKQLKAVLNVSKSPLSIITGGPGVGKTTVINEIVRHSNKEKVKVYLAAPTGRAAKRMSEACRHRAMTIHRMLKWDPSESSFYYGYRKPLPCDLLVVDEVSMLDLPLALNLFRAVAPGTTVVLVGDSDQLPSVGPGNVLSDIIRWGGSPVTHLTTIYRQKEGSSIIEYAHQINRGRIPEFPEPDSRDLQDFYWIDQNEPEKVSELIVRLVGSRIPRRFRLNPLRDIQVLSPMNRGNCGTVQLNQLLQETLNPPSGRRPQFKWGDTTFRGADRIMQTVNNYDKNVFNGDMGRIARIDLRNKRFSVNYDTGMVEYDFIEADQIVPAYAITVHKSQGSEFPAVVVPILTQHYIMLQRNLIYTAMSRAKKLLVMIGSRKALSIAVRNARLEPRYSLLLNRLAESDSAVT